MNSRLFAFLLLLGSAVATPPAFDRDGGFPIRDGDRVLIKQQDEPLRTAPRIVRDDDALNLVSSRAACSGRNCRCSRPGSLRA